MSLAVCSLVGVTALEFDLLVTNSLIGFVFFGTITGYNFVKYAETARFRHRSLNLSLRAIQVFSFFCFLALIYFALKLPIKTLLIIGGFAALTFFYAIPFLKNKNLRTFIGIKILIVAIVWGGVTIIIPIINEDNFLTETIWISFLQRVLFVFALTLPFEIRDLIYDELALGTLPQRLGVFVTKIVGTILLVISLLVEFFKVESNKDYILSFGIIGVVLLIFLFVSNRKQSKYFASFWVESIPVLWFAMMLLFLK